MPPAWRIYYADGSRVDGAGAAAWRRAPAEGVQVVVIFEPVQVQRFSHWPKDRRGLTGDDAYDPFGWGGKRGSLIDDGAYRAIWERAGGDPGP